MKRQIYEDIAAFVFILLFTYTGLAKLYAHSTFYAQLQQQPVTKALAPFLSVFLPVAELLVTVTLLIPRFRLIGWWGSLCLMMLFTGYVVTVLYLEPHTHLPCSCGGIIKRLTWRQHLVLNVFLIFLSVIGLRLYCRDKSSTNRVVNQMKIASWPE